MFARLVAIVLLVTAVPALAQAQSAQRSKPAKNDPGRIICEKVEQIGSRLATKRICMTAAQWAEKRRMDREDLESSQQRHTSRTE
jgi:hypothetical protein